MENMEKPQLYMIGCTLKNCNIDITRAEADKIFLEIMKECGVGVIKRQFMYRMVRIVWS